ncbi:MAG: PLP-dependent aminotransferase family protein [Bacillota bacterium]|nr:PLP-dependent aminotransferase family protein [Bacillota bacterium]
MIYIDRTISKPIYEQIYSYYTDEILSGALPSGSRLPATRKLAEELSLGRNTVDKAYQQLVAEGYIHSKPGSGFIVNSIPSGICSEPATALPQHKTILKTNAPEYDFAYGNMDNSIFPYNQWRKCINNALSTMELADTIRYPERTGEPILRKEISKYLYHSRGVRCHPEQVIITCGQQHSMEIIANMFDESPRKTFAMEDPGYDGIREVFLNHKFRMEYIPVNDDGICMNNVYSLETDLLYVTPSHQFPTGAVLSIGKRKELLNWAESTNTFLIEDDYDSELRYYTNPIPAMQSLDKNGRTIYTGTFSKSLSPSMRLAYIIFPETLLNKYYKYYHRYNSQVSTLHQLALAEFMSAGYYERHINRLRTLYKKKQAALLAALIDVFGDDIEVYGEGAGIHLLLNVKGTLSQETLIEKAAIAGIRLYSSRPLYAVPSRCPDNQLLIGFPTIPQNNFKKIILLLKQAWYSE